MRPGSALRLAAVSGCAAVVLTACRGDDSPPTTLLDGSPAVAPPVALDGVGRPAIMAEAAVSPRRRVAAGSAEAACLRGSDDGGSGPLAVRVGATATSATFRVLSGRALVACDGVSRGGVVGAWCGRAFGLLREGRLEDPRLDLACVRPDGRPVAFAWIEPTQRARYVAVEEPGYVEVYAAAGGLRSPVRVVTTDVDVSSSSASFDVSEHDRAGRLLRRYRLEATVSG
jgi:hypothetical protein